MRPQVRGVPLLRGRGSPWRQALLASPCPPRIGTSPPLGAGPLASKEQAPAAPSPSTASHDALPYGLPAGALAHQGTSLPSPWASSSSAPLLIPSLTGLQAEPLRTRPHGAPGFGTQEPVTEEEATRVFRPNLHEHDLKRSDVPLGDSLPPSADFRLPSDPKLPHDLRPILSGSALAEELLSLHDEPTRTYSRDALQQLSQTEDGAVPGLRISDTIQIDPSMLSESQLAGSLAAGASSGGRPGGTRDASGLREATAVHRELQGDLKTELRERPRRARHPRAATAWFVLVVSLVGATMLLAGLVGPALLSRSGVNLPTWGPFGAWLGSLQPAGPAAATKTPPELSPSVNLSISVEPPEARLFLDGRPVANPLTVTLPRDRRAHELRAEAFGFRPLSRPLIFDRDLWVMLSLQEQTPEPATSPELKRLGRSRFGKTRQ